ncbi:MAG: efflux RND transporter periplasmic adaptor subunit [Candidatus Melainabacteria bacterium]|nr:efflux RND transporter periplasmic adaptor subunit [Candidatus Melainabacteria bacterium]
MTTPVPPPKNLRKRNKAIAITVAIFLIIGLAYLIYWLVWARFHEYTDDSYVDGNNVVLTPQIPGTVVSFSVLDADYVCQGRTLVELDKTDASIALDKSIADLGNAVRDVMKLFEQAKQYFADISMRKAEFVKAAQDYEHRKMLVEGGGVSLENFEHSEAALQASFAELISAEHKYIGTLSQIENTTVENHPMVEQMKSKVRDAWVFYQRCTIKAPVSGIIAQRTVQVGEQVKLGQPLLAIVPLDQMWVTSNYKEVQLSKMRVGQPVKVTSDIYGDKVVFHGTVAGIGGGTGSVFSVLPPQNATGNWIKIVQRIPVRIMLDPQQIIDHPLRLGLSMETTVDIHDTDKPFVPEVRPDMPLYTTDVFAEQEAGAEALIADVIEANMSPSFIEDNTE